MSFLELHSLGEVNITESGLRLRSFTGYEEISRLFVFKLELDFLETVPPTVTPAGVIGKTIVFSLDTGIAAVNDDGTEQTDGNGDVVIKRRFLSGIVNRYSIGHLDATNSRRFCRMEVAPPLWKLTEIIDSRTFPALNVAGLVEQVRQNEGLNTDLDADYHNLNTDLSRHPARKNPVQYGESTMNFLARLMYEEGIFYFFQERIELSGKQKLVLGDLPTHYDDPGITLTYEEAAGNPQSVTTWEAEYQYRSSNWQQQTYDYRDSGNPGDSTLGSGGMHKFTRSGQAAFTDRTTVSERLADSQDRELVQQRYARAASGCALLYPGVKWTLQDHPYDNGTYVVTAVEHRASQFASDGTPVQEYQNGFICAPASANHTVTECPFGANSSRNASVTFPGQSILQPAATAAGHSAAAPAVASRPPVRGQSVAELAVVVDSSGRCAAEGKVAVYKHQLTDGGGAVVGEIDHVYVRYQWDQDDWQAENRRVRVVQPVAGAQWGAKFLPRIGQEVVVLFVNGDPDNEYNVVVGALNNDKHCFVQPTPSPQMQTVKPRRQDRDSAGKAQDVFPNRNGGYLPNLDQPGQSGDHVAHYTGATDETQTVALPALHEDKVSGFRTRSYDADNANPRYNELLFDDTRDAEQLYMHASRDLNILVDNDLNLEVKGDKKEIIRGNHYQVICLGDTTAIPTTRQSRDAQGALSSGTDTVQNFAYQPAAKYGSQAVFRGVTDGVSFDVDKTIGVKTIAYVRTEGSDVIWKERSETYMDQESRAKGDTVSVHIGDSESYQWEGNDFSVFGGSQQSIFMGLQMSEFLGLQQSLFIGPKLEFSFSLDMGVTAALKLTKDVTGVHKAGFKFELDDTKVERETTAIVKKELEAANITASIENMQLNIATIKNCIRNIDADISQGKLCLRRHEAMIRQAKSCLFLVDVFIFL